MPSDLSVGEMAEATIQLPPIAQSLIIPAASIQRQGGSSGVWRMESGKPVFTPIKVGVTSLDGHVQILEGIKAGDQIVVYSQKPLEPSSRLQVVETIIRSANSSGSVQ